MTIPVYNTGTVSVSANGTVVSGGGTTIWGNNVREGDFIVIDGAAITMVLAVTDDDNLVIPEWKFGAKTNVEYAIYQNYSARSDVDEVARDLGKLVAALNKEGFIWFVGPAEGEPDPSNGDEDQWAYQPSTGKQWHKEGGNWVFDGVFKALGTPAPYDNDKSYSLNDVATSGGSSYVWINPTSGAGHAPPNATYWDVLAGKGEQGEEGTAATVTIGTVTTVPNATPASVTNVGTSLDAILNFEIPRGLNGDGAGDMLAADNLSTLTDKPQALFNLNVETIKNLAAAQALSFPAQQKNVFVQGYHKAGDEGGAAYERVTSEPSHAGKFRSLDRFLPNGTTDNINGGWWEIASNPVDLRMLGAKGDGVTNDDAAWVAFHGYLSTHIGIAGRMTKGRYLISSDLNWAIYRLKMETEGEVTLVSSSTGTALRFSGTSGYGAVNVFGVHGIHWERTIVEADAAVNGILVDRCHQSYFELTCSGAVSNGIVSYACVSTTYFQPTVSYNSTAPSRWPHLPNIGLYISGSSTDGANANCSFIQPILECGGAKIGVSVDYSLLDLMYGGTSEGNGVGFDSTVNTKYFTINGTDFEANTNYDIRFNGAAENTIRDVQTQKLIILNGATCKGNLISGGTHGAILETGGATNNRVCDINYNRYGGGLALTLDATTARRSQNNYNVDAGTYDGQFGDYQESTLSFPSRVSLTPNIAKTVTSLTLPAGDWDVAGVIGFYSGAATSSTRYVISINTTNNTLSGVADTDHVFAAFANGGLAPQYPVMSKRLSLAASTTVYLVALSTFTAGTMEAFGTIRARRCA